MSTSDDEPLSKLEQLSTIGANIKTILPSGLLTGICVGTYTDGMEVTISDPLLLVWLIALSLVVGALLVNKFKMGG